MMYNNFSVTVYGALDHVHIFSDFRLVNVYLMTQRGPSPTALAPLRTTIDTGRTRVAGGGAHYFFHKGPEICRPKIFVLDK
jgi:hypothetical protein